MPLQLYLALFRHDFVGYHRLRELAISGVMLSSFALPASSLAGVRWSMLVKPGLLAALFESLGVTGTSFRLTPFLQLQPFGKSNMAASNLEILNLSFIY